MRLTRKLALALLVGILVITGIAGVVRVRSEAQHFLDDMSRDHAFVGHAIRNAIESVWASDGEARAAGLVHTPRGHVSLRIVTLDPNALRQRQPGVRPELLQGIRRGEDVALTRDGRFYTYVPLQVPAPGSWALEVSEGLEEQRQYVRSTVLPTLLALCAIVVVCSGLAIGLGYWFVGRPMVRLTEKARRIGAGDLSGPLVLEQHDEIAEFAVEMNAMCDRLGKAQQTLQAETTARIDAIEQLRHADRLRTVGQLASGVAHELGTPLNVVLGRALMITAEDTTPEECADNARIIADQARRMTTLIRQLLDFARPRGPQCQTLDLRELARTTVNMLAPLGDRHRVKIAFTPSDQAVQAEVDPTQMQQALTNLVMNAVQAIGDRGGTVSISVGAENTRPPADLGGEEQTFCFVRVHDDGEGIPRENLARIFEPFFTTKDVGDGTGLGLSVAYGIIRDHDGWIDVESEPGRGSTFTLYVPPQRPDPARASPRISQGLFDGTPRATVIR